MKAYKAYIKILRIHNALIAAVAVILGFWLSDSTYPLWALGMLFLSTVTATGFGNVINDLRDIESDRISHPERPLPKGDISSSAAWSYCFILAAVSLVCGFSVSMIHGFATLIPVTVLVVYSFFLKGTPLAGNVVVALLVAYSILYGALDAPGFQRLILPAFFAFLLNISREIIKDIQDEAGDKASGVITSAILPHSILRGLTFVFSIVYLSCLLIPYLTHNFGIPYLIVCLIIIAPIHIYRSVLIMSKQWKQYVPRISTLYKVEMVCGLAAIAIDKLV